jgi:hypothetical protein
MTIHNQYHPAALQKFVSLRKYQKSMRGVGNEGIIIFVLLHSFNDHAGCNPIFLFFAYLQEK